MSAGVHQVGLLAPICRAWGLDGGARGGADGSGNCEGSQLLLSAGTISQELWFGTAMRICIFGPACCPGLARLRCPQYHNLSPSPCLALISTLHSPFPF